MDQKVRVSDLLRKALVVARKLRIAEFETWINHELRGYPEGHDYPAYRRMHGQLKAYNLHYGWQPVMFRNPDAARDLSSRLVSSTVAQLEASVNGGEAYGMIPVDDDVAFQISADMDRPPTSFALHVPINEDVRILDTIRNTVLDWALRLEADGILGENLSFTSEEKKTAEASHYTLVFHGPVTNSQVQQGVEGSSQTMEITGADFRELGPLVDRLLASTSGLGLIKESQQELEAQLNSIRAQLASKDPALGFINACWRIVQGLMLNVAGNVVAAQIMQDFPKYFAIR